MSFHQDLDSLVKELGAELSQGASVQSTVDRHFKSISLFLRKKGKSGGSITLKQFSNFIGVNFFTFRTAIRRAANKKPDKDFKVRSLNAVKKEKLFVEKNNYGNLSDLKIVLGDALVETDIDHIKSLKPFLYKPTSDSGTFKMIFNERQEEKYVFDAFLKAGESALSKTINFNAIDNYFF